MVPEAGLFDASGRQIGWHYAGPQWEAADGSRAIGALKSRADAPKGGCTEAGAPLFRVAA